MILEPLCRAPIEEHAFIQFFPIDRPSLILVFCVFCPPSKGMRKLAPAVNFLMATDDAAKRDFMESVQKIEAFRR